MASKSSPLGEALVAELLLCKVSLLCQRNVVARGKRGDKVDRSQAFGAAVAQLATTMRIPYRDKSILCQKFGDGGMIFTHGAGGGMHSAATADFVSGFAEVSPVLSFQGNMNLKSRVAMFRTVIEHEGGTVLGGRSMGSRAAIMARTEETTELVLVSYPLAGGRGALLQGIEQDVLFIIGSKDKMCPLDEVNKARGKSWLIEIEGLDHGMKNEELCKASGRLAAEWLNERDDEKRYLCLRLGEEGPEHGGWISEEA